MNDTNLWVHSMINGWVRALLASIAGWLISKGVIDAASAQSLTVVLVPAVSGVVLLLGTGLWSMAEKRMHEMMAQKGMLLPSPVASVASNPPTG